jgi:hypothetical protein
MWICVCVCVCMCVCVCVCVWICVCTEKFLSEGDDVRLVVTEDGGSLKNVWVDLKTLFDKVL